MGNGNVFVTGSVAVNCPLLLPAPNPLEHVISHVTVALCGGEDDA